MNTDKIVKHVGNLNKLRETEENENLKVDCKNLRDSLKYLEMSDTRLHGMKLGISRLIASKSDFSKMSLSDFLELLDEDEELKRNDQSKVSIMKGVANRYE